MTDQQAQAWHLTRLQDLRRMIDRAKSLDDLHRIERATRHELTTDLHAHLSRRVIDMKRVKA